VRVVRAVTLPAGRSALVARGSGAGGPEARAAPPQPGPVQDCHLTPPGASPAGIELCESPPISHVSPQRRSASAAAAGRRPVSLKFQKFSPPASNTFLDVSTKSSWPRRRKLRRPVTRPSTDVCGRPGPGSVHPRRTGRYVYCTSTADAAPAGRGRLLLYAARAQATGLSLANRRDRVGSASACQSAAALAAPPNVAAASHS
jgi:hypothetical protein